jgi:hypothetical protein
LQGFGGLGNSVGGQQLLQVQQRPTINGAAGYGQAASNGKLLGSNEVSSRYASRNTIVDLNRGQGGVHQAGAIGAPVGYPARNIPVVQQQQQQVTSFQPGYQTSAGVHSHRQRVYKPAIDSNEQFDEPSSLFPVQQQQQQLLLAGQGQAYDGGDVEYGQGQGAAVGYGQGQGTAGGYGDKRPVVPILTQDFVLNKNGYQF